jgi:hypothetical protein
MSTSSFGPECLFDAKGHSQDVSNSDRCSPAAVTVTVTENAPCAVYHDAGYLLFLQEQIKDHHHHHHACDSESEYLPVCVYACERYADTGGSFCAEARVYSKHWHKDSEQSTGSRLSGRRRWQRS